MCTAVLFPNHHECAFLLKQALRIHWTPSMQSQHIHKPQHTPAFLHFNRRAICARHIANTVGSAVSCTCSTMTFCLAPDSVPPTVSIFESSINTTSLDADIVDRLGVSGTSVGCAGNWSLLWPHTSACGLLELPFKGNQRTQRYRSLELPTQGRNTRVRGGNPAVFGS
jgi:hypothetical protein